MYIWGTTTSNSTKIMLGIAQNGRIKVGVIKN